MHECSVAKLCPTLVIPWIVACQAPLSMGFSRQEYWSGLPSSKGTSQLRDQTPYLRSPALAGRFFTTSATWEALMTNRQGEKWKQILKSVTHFLFSGSKISVDGDCSHKIKRCLILGIKL